MAGKAQDALDRYLSTIERLNPGLGALVAIDEGRARVRAESLDAGADRGALHGLIVTVKDNIESAGLPTTNGNSNFFNAVSRQDAEIVSRLRRAGAVIVGKSNLHEFALGATTQNPHLGCCRNAWNPNVIPGGSSGGAGSAVAAELCAVAIGTDTGGSIRIPAALNGVSGLRPTFGSVSCRGSFPTSPQLDTVGPLAYRVTDLARVFVAIAGYDALDPYATRHPDLSFLPSLHDGIGGVRIGVPRRFFFDDLGNGIGECVNTALQDLERCGAVLVEIDVPGSEDAQQQAGYVLATTDAAMVHRERLRDTPDKFGDDVRERLLAALDTSGTTYAHALDWCARYRSMLRKIFDKVDLIVTPTTPVVAPAIGEAGALRAALARLSRFTYGWSGAGLPACSLPCGFAGGLPVGLQLVAPWFEEGLLLRAGVSYQEQTEWHRHRPVFAPFSPPSSEPPLTT